jgi:hypothetical protein
MVSFRSSPVMILVPTYLSGYFYQSQQSFPPWGSTWGYMSDIFTWFFPTLHYNWEVFHLTCSLWKALILFPRALIAQL